MSLFRTKPIDQLVAEGSDEGTGLKRELTAVDLMALGIGAIIGAGIFATLGTAASGGGTLPPAGPGVVVSILLTALACGFCGLCYAEFASLVPVAGSAYTYSYATLGELVAWIIGWDLILEYAVGNIAVAISWAAYFRQLLLGFGLEFPAFLATDYRSTLLAAKAVAGGGDRSAFARAVGRVPGAPAPPGALRGPDRLQPPRGAHHGGHHHPPREGNQGIGARQRLHRRPEGRDAPLLRRRRRLLRQAGELAPLLPGRLLRGLDGGLPHVLRLHRLRRDLDGGRGVQGPRARHAARHPRVAGRLHRPLRRRGPRPLRDDPVHEARGRGRPARRGARLRESGLGGRHPRGRRGLLDDGRPPRLPARPAAHPDGDVAGRAHRAVVREDPPEVPDAPRRDDPDGRLRRDLLGGREHRRDHPADEHRDALRVRPRLHRDPRPALQGARPAAEVPGAVRPARPAPGHRDVRRADGQASGPDVGAVRHLARRGARIYFLYGRRRSRLARA
ncbi:MAG: amino acid permease [Holophagales bacterium]|nr:amino acid permease [Holophagales bacterium]